MEPPPAICPSIRHPLITPEVGVDKSDHRVKHQYGALGHFQSAKKLKKIVGQVASDNILMDPLVGVSQSKKLS